ncbi:MAG: acetyltransferase [Clostridia bacterium]|nr:acetyltransferase [Clostridia bacterium]
MDKKRLLIIGAGGHGKVVFDIAAKCGYLSIGFLDDADENNPLVLAGVSDFKKYINEAEFFVAIGNSRVREKILSDLIANGAEIATLIHPNAVVAQNVQIGCGTVVMASAVINPDTFIGDGVIINTSSSVDHDCKVADFCHVSVGSHLCGTVNVDSHTWIGAGATVINNINICSDCMIGAGAVVVSDINVSGVYVGVPAKFIKKL